MSCGSVPVVGQASTVEYDLAAGFERWSLRIRQYGISLSLLHYMRESNRSE